MTIIKNTPHLLYQQKRFYTTSPTATIQNIKDGFALGLYVYLSSQSEKWEINEKQLMGHFGKSRDFIRARLKYLKDAGLIKKFTIKNEKGQIVRWETVLYDEPQKLDKFEDPSDDDSFNSQYVEEDIESLENHIPENPVTRENPPLVEKTHNNILSINNKNTTTKPPIVPQGGQDECLNAFCLFWALYPVKTAKAVCLKYWTKNKLHKVANEIMPKLKLQIEQDDRFLRGFIRNPAKYLREEGWKDDIFTAKGHANGAQDIRELNGLYGNY
jgi:hypothetical protein